MIPDKAHTQAIATRPFVITFSGIDGAGKTTQSRCGLVDNARRNRRAVSGPPPRG